MKTEVHLDWVGDTHHVGMLYSLPNKEAVIFEYSESWLTKSDSFPIDPALPLTQGKHQGAVLFGSMQDAGPDRWGRKLIQRAVKKKTIEAKPYQAIDYVLALSDISRIGALRFRQEGVKEFQSSAERELPPMIRLNQLLQSADAIHAETDTAEDLRFLLNLGSPLGGARPKSVVQLDQERMAIAKFPKPDDTFDIASGEVLALSLAKEAGLNVADYRLVDVGGKKVSVITRFDRDSGRIPFISASTLCSLPPGEPGSYTTIAEAIREYGDNVIADLHELWSRMVFSMLICNVDDHMRNHGFLMNNAGKWSLSPAYDLNPVPITHRSTDHKTAISEEFSDQTIERAIKVCPQFKLKESDAVVILQKQLTVLGRWREVGRQLEISASTLDTYESAFKNDYVDEALRMA